ncbi:MarR family winged helix-turn-helix transcriptional regulator [Yaniella halotolerans]|uniref:MarR family winged helix-turn-helix transcriptional regulator n=1 Tax=Yaniella halotolerans TaxID=225453 RepID=UPI0003B59C6A|nr:MarR family winged helix-turn-helix transcriptional regulator [Yaniella halotolerans]
MTDRHSNNGQSTGVAGLLSATYHFMMSRIMDRLGTEGYGNLSKTQLHVLARFDSSGMTLRQISDRVQISVHIVSNIVNMLRTNDYVAEMPSATPADGSKYMLTGLGQEALTIVESEQKAVEREWKQHIGEERLSSIISSLELLFRATLQAKGDRD